MRVEILRLVLGLAALGLVLYSAIGVLAPFVRPMLWALVLGSATWTGYQWLCRRLGGRCGLAALIMTLALTILVVVPTGLLCLALVKEMRPLIEELRAWARAENLVLPPWIERFPLLADQLRDLLDLMSDPLLRTKWLRDALGTLQPLLHVGRNLLAILVDIVLTLFTLFFVYRHGKDLLDEVQLLLGHIAGGRALPLLDAVRKTVRAVLYGWLLTAAGQGLVAMLGFWIVGLRAPVLLGVATAVAALVPFGVGLVWIPVILWLAIQGVWWKVIFMASWSLLVVSVIDNILRPLFISGPTRIPFIIVFFGVLGGLATYGLLGLILGPVLLAVLLALWHQSHEVLGVRRGRLHTARE